MAVAGTMLHAASSIPSPITVGGYAQTILAVQLAGWQDRC